MSAPLTTTTPPTTIQAPLAELEKLKTFELPGRIQNLIGTHSLALDMPDLPTRGALRGTNRFHPIAGMASAAIPHSRAQHSKPDIPQEGWNQLHYAAYDGQLSALWAHEDDLAGVHINSQDARGFTPIHIAVLAGEVRSAMVLLERGAEVSIVDHQGRSLIHEAVKHDPELWLPLLLRRGMDINASDARGNTALMLAAQSGSAALVQLLVENGAQRALMDENKYRAIHHVKGCNLKEVREKYAALAPDIHFAEVRYSNNKSILHQCIDSNNGWGFDYLLGLGLDPNAQDSDGWSVLHAIAANKSSIGHSLRLLLQCPDLKLSLVDSQDRTPLHIAAGTGNDAVLKVLLTYELDVSAQDNKGNTALHHAATHQMNLTRLLEAKADPSMANNEGKTPLHLLVEMGASIEEILQLIKAGARIDETLAPLRTAKGQHLVHWIFENDRKERMHAHPYTKVRSILEKCCGDLGAAGIDLNALDGEDEETLLHRAAQMKNHSLTVALLKAGMDPNIQDVFGDTPLHIWGAYYWGKSEVWDKLLKAGASEKITNYSGDKPVYATRKVERAAELARLPLKGIKSAWHSLTDSKYHHRAEDELENPFGHLSSRPDSLPRTKTRRIAKDAQADAVEYTVTV